MLLIGPSMLFEIVYRIPVLLENMTEYENISEMNWQQTIFFYKLF